MYAKSCLFEVERRNDTVNSVDWDDLDYLVEVWTWLYVLG